MALVFLGPRFWPIIFLAALTANRTAGIPWMVSAGIAVGNTLEAWVGAKCPAWRWTHFDPVLSRIRDVARPPFLRRAFQHAFLPLPSAS